MAERSLVLRENGDFVELIMTMLQVAQKAIGHDGVAFAEGAKLKLAGMYIDLVGQFLKELAKLRYPFVGRYSTAEDLYAGVVTRQSQGFRHNFGLKCARQRGQRS